MSGRIYPRPRLYDWAEEENWSDLQHCPVCHHRTAMAARGHTEPNES